MLSALMKRSLEATGRRIFFQTAGAGRARTFVPRKQSTLLGSTRTKLPHFAPFSSHNHRFRKFNQVSRVAQMEASTVEQLESNPLITVEDPLRAITFEQVLKRVHPDTHLSTTLH